MFNCEAFWGADRLLQVRFHLDNERFCLDMVIELIPKHPTSESIADRFHPLLLWAISQNDTGQFSPLLSGLRVQKGRAS